MKLYLTHLALHKKLDHYHLRIAADPWAISLVHDENLGVIMSSFSFGLKCLQADTLNLPRPKIWEHGLTPNAIELSVYSITPLHVEPWRWQLHMQWDQGHTPYTYTANIDRDLESLIAAYAGAMRFFAIKSGLALMDEDFSIRNIQQASEDGYRWINRPAEEEDPS